MAAQSVLAFREGGAHLGRGICCKQLHIPFLLDFSAKKVELKVLVAQAFADADYTADAAVFIVDIMLFGVLDEFQYERRHAHDGVGLNATDSVPLQLRDAVADSDDAGTKLAKPKKISQSRHETLVQGGH